MPNYTSDFPEVKKWARYFQKFFASDNSGNYQHPPGGGGRDLLGLCGPFRFVALRVPVRRGHGLTPVPAPLVLADLRGRDARERVFPCGSRRVPIPVCEGDKGTRMLQTNDVVNLCAGSSVVHGGGFLRQVAALRMPKYTTDFPEVKKETKYFLRPITRW